MFGDNVSPTKFNLHVRFEQPRRLILVTRPYFNETIHLGDLQVHVKASSVGQGAY
jgi:hypothetical protein